MNLCLLFEVVKYPLNDVLWFWDLMIVTLSACTRNADSRKDIIDKWYHDNGPA